MLAAATAPPQYSIALNGVLLTRAGARAMYHKEADARAAAKAYCAARGKWGSAIILRDGIPQSRVVIPKPSSSNA